MTSSSETTPLTLDEIAVRPRPASRVTSADDETVRRAAAGAVERGWQAGFAAGRQAGYEDGARAGQAEIDVALRALAQAAADFRTRLTVDFRSAEDALVAGAVELAGMILDRELGALDDPGAEALARALSLAPDRPATVRMHPADVERLAEAAVPAGALVEVVADASVEPGGCVLEAGSTTVDSQIGPALERARAHLQGGRA